MASREYRQRRPWFGADLRLGAVLALALSIKFVPPMLSAKIDQAPPAPVLAAASDASVPPTDALTNTLPTSVRAPAANEPSVLASPVFELEEKKPLSAKSSPQELPKSEPKSDPLDPPKPPSLANASKKTDDVPPKPVKLRPPESLRADAPIVLADAPKKAESIKVASDAPSKSPEKKGPIHPYFQRYLDQKEYYVRPGDTLSSIAHRLYQDESKAADLLAANKDSLPSADALKEGMTIKLP
jgi:nucleoid-associated protein YgaU